MVRGTEGGTGRKQYSTVMCERVYVCVSVSMAKGLQQQQQEQLLLPGLKRRAGTT
jgi:hypothetical protein